MRTGFAWKVVFGQDPTFEATAHLTWKRPFPGSNQIDFLLCARCTTSIASQMAPILPWEGGCLQRALSSPSGDGLQPANSDPQQSSLSPTTAVKEKAHARTEKARHT